MEFGVAFEFEENVFFDGEIGHVDGLTVEFRFLLHFYDKEKRFIDLHDFHKHTETLTSDFVDVCGCEGRLPLVFFR